MIDEFNNRKAQIADDLEEHTKSLEKDKFKNILKVQLQESASKADRERARTD